MRIKPIIFLLAYTILVVSFFLRFLKIDQTDYEGTIKIIMGYDNLYFYLNLFIVTVYGAIYLKTKSLRFFKLVLILLSIIFALNVFPVLLHPFTFGTNSLQIAFYLHYFAISSIVLLIYIPTMNDRTSHETNNKN